MKKLLYVSLALSVLLVAFIFWNSCKTAEESSEISGVFSSLLEPILGRFFEGKEISLGHFVRKVAHFVEFFALGFSVSLTLVSVKALRKKTFYGIGLFFVLAVGVLDEYVQLFSARGSFVADIILDFSGAIMGFAAVFAASYLGARFRARKAEKIEKGESL